MFFLGYGFFMGFFGSPAYTRTHEYVVTDFACYSGKHKERSSLFYGIGPCGDSAISNWDRSLMNIQPFIRIGIIG